MDYNDELEIDDTITLLRSKDAVMYKNGRVFVEEPTRPNYIAPMYGFDPKAFRRIARQEITDHRKWSRWWMTTPEAEHVIDQLTCQRR